MVQTYPAPHEFLKQKSVKLISPDTIKPQVREPKKELNFEVATKSVSRNEKSIAEILGGSKSTADSNTLKPPMAYLH